MFSANHHHRCCNGYSISRLFLPFILSPWLTTNNAFQKNFATAFFVTTPKTKSIENVRSSPIKVSLSSSENYDWSFVDKAYLITCPNADANSERLKGTLKILGRLNLGDKVEVKEFDTDDEDRIRGCYTSHISVMKDALNDIKREEGGESLSFLEDIFKSLDNKSNNRKEISKRSKNVLILEDNLDFTNKLQQSTIDSVTSFIQTNSATEWSMIHLSFIPYVPNLQVTPSTTHPNTLIQLRCGVGSALGTTAYLINQPAMTALINRDTLKNGYHDTSIPDAMALEFPESRYSMFPTPFVRSSNTKSLVNPRLDDLRSVLFVADVNSLVHTLLVQTGWTTNRLLVVFVGGLLGLTLVSSWIAVGAIWEVVVGGASGGGGLLLALVSAGIAFFCLAVIGQGIALAPPPPPTTTSD